MKEGYIKLTKVVSAPVLSSHNQSHEFSKYIHKSWKSINLEVNKYFKTTTHVNDKSTPAKPFLKVAFTKLTERQMQYVRWAAIVILFLSLLFLSTALKFGREKSGKQTYGTW